ncbi:MAG: LysM peptidoglycan-binding domain-containing protein [bacterium]
MNYQTIRVVVGVNLVAGCLLLQGCGMFSGGKKADPTIPTVPGGEPPPVETTTNMPPVETAPIELPAVQITTPYTIQKGDLITTVAYKYGLRWQDVMAVNPGLDAKKLRVGQVIQLPGQVDVSKARHVPTSTPKTSAPKISAPKSSSPAASGPMTTYVVKSGDSLSVIAHKHGIKTAALREANGLKSDRISVGQKLKIVGAKKTPQATGGIPKAAPASAPKTDAPKTDAPKIVTPKNVVSNATPETLPVTAPPPVAEVSPVKIDAPATPVADSSTQTYTVKEGEDLYAVAIRWGVSPSDLKALNNLTSTELKAGTVLKIPGAAQ